jgi:phage terminase small subunit
MAKAETGFKQRRTRFVKEYLLDQNATRAAKEAGYSEKTAYSQGQRLLKDAEISAAIESENERINSKLDLTLERVRQEIARLCYYDPRKYWNPDGSAKPLTELDEDSARAISGFEMAELFSGSGEERAAVGYIKKFKLADKTRALELASRHLGALRDRVEVTDTNLILQRLAAGRERIARS